MRLLATLPFALLMACAPQAPVDADTPSASDTSARSEAPVESADNADIGTASATTPLPEGAQAPDFTAQAWLAGEPFRFTLTEALAKGPVVVYFFPAAFTPGCNLEARLFSESIDAFKQRNATVIGVTAGNADQLAAFSSDNETCSGKFAVAADPGAQIAAQYGAVLESRPEWTSRTSFAIAADGRILRVHSDMSAEEHVRQMLAGLDG
ncbi:MAG: peroxiredoxin [Pseudoxanthomonas suwonensis]|nr:peroxiredoxin [Pseudoxanthomonas suwonensis]